MAVGGLGSAGHGIGSISTLGEGNTGSSLSQGGGVDTSGILRKLDSRSNHCCHPQGAVPNRAFSGPGSDSEFRGMNGVAIKTIVNCTGYGQTFPFVVK
ncbi:hypothetical protein AVEN_14954-1 [Araneus ventricosus]|uniref:Uncharacterized protein n=1 Tax=Araneus ventricosus TaxID=182803 RepID=A0A4Y2F7I5_ARAVE|nr:hypothetical protein AVEN_14954-1 [Araneus ventricosus]